VDEDATAGGNITGTLGLLNPFVTLDENGELIDIDLTLSQLGTKIDDNHFEIGDNFVTRNPMEQSA
jgi:hypothetical protein